LIRLAFAKDRIHNQGSHQTTLIPDWKRYEGGGVCVATALCPI